MRYTREFDRVRGGWDRGAEPPRRPVRFRGPDFAHPGYGRYRAYDVRGGYGFGGETTRIAGEPRGYDRGFRGRGGPGRFSRW